MTTPISATEIESGLPTKAQNLFTISCSTIQREGMPVILSFYKAINTILPKVSICHVIHVVFASDSFNLSLLHGNLHYTPKSNVESSNVDNYVFLDVDKLFKKQEPIRTAIILEELVHAIMLVTNEPLAHKIVCEIFNDVIYSDGEFQKRDQ